MDTRVAGESGSNINRWHRPVEFALAAVLAISAALKALQIFSTHAPVIGGIFQYRIVEVLSVQVELFLATWLLVGGFPQLRMFLSLACFSMFFLVAMYEAFHSFQSCGCFGDLRMPPTITAIFDGIAVCLLLGIAWQKSSSLGDVIRPVWRRYLYCLLAILLSALLWSGYALKKPSVDNSASLPNSGSKLVVLEPKTWINRRFPLLDHINNSSSIQRGKWLIVLYHHDCDSCLQAIPNYRAWAISHNNSSTSEHLAFVAMPPVATHEQDPVVESSNYEHLVLRPDSDWFATTPVVVAIEDGRVLAAADGEDAISPPTLPAWNR